MSYKNSLNGRQENKMTTKITNISDYTNNTLSISSEQAIEELQKFQKENPDYNKVILIAVNNKNEEFLWQWWKTQMTCSEAIAALHLVSNDQTMALRGEDS